MIGVLPFEVLSTNEVAIESTENYHINKGHIFSSKLRFIFSKSANDNNYKLKKTRVVKEN